MTARNDQEGEGPSQIRIDFSQDDTGEARSPWPPQTRFPLNEAGTEVGETVAESYEASTSFTIVTAFTSLEHLLAFFSQNEVGDRSIDIVLGSEPTTREGSLYVGTQPVEEQARDYWLEKGVSVLTGGGIVRLIEAMTRGKVRFYAGEDLHAKIYVGEDGAVVGSSNFSRHGFGKQREANARFESGSTRYGELCEVAAQFKEQARECTSEIKRLLEDLLQPVQWEEALARASAEVLEGDWVDRYPEVFRLLQDQNLWPHQEEAIAQGLWILDTRGSVLVADATGSGKTRVGTHLLYGLLNRLWSKGQGHRTNSTVVCPPNVTGEWSEEIQKSSANSVEAISHGKLSQGNQKEEIHRQVRQSNVLFLDEAHNYLSTGTERSKAVEESAPDYISLLTATPINRGSSDLLRMIELLGLDNLSDREFQTYKELRKKTNLTGEDEQALRRIVRQCTIRRTKQDLNRIVERKTDGYRSEDGTVHRFPEHICKTYLTGETDKDKEIAREINQISEDLKGLPWLRTFKAPFWVVGDEEREKDFLERKIKGAKGLAAHGMRSALQSSRAALLEVVFGTAEASRRLGLEADLKTESGDRLSAVEELRRDPPEENSNLEIDLPEWLTSGLEETIEKEKERLRQIGDKASQLSDARAKARAQKIQEIAREEDVLLAFGARPLTLYDLRDQLRNRKLGQEVVVADGSLSAGKKRSIIKRLGLEGGTQTTIGEDGEGEVGLVALCSDAMSEGLNLQRAGSVVLLDTPSVIRIAEQRVGRIDRMDSPHDEIEVWWPSDSRPFQSARRDLLIERYNVNERLMGNNIKLPEPLQGEDGLFSEQQSRRASAEELIEEYETHQREGPDERLEDAFQPVRRLVGLGDETDHRTPPLIDKEVYKHIAGTSKAVWSRVTIMESEKRWGFFCLRGREGRAPRWVLLHQGSEKDAVGLGFEESEWRVTTRLGPIARRLRKLLPRARRAPNQGDPALWESVGEELEEMLGRIRRNERELLSNKAQHGLDLLKELVVRYKTTADEGTNRKQASEFLSDVLTMDKKPWADLHDLADRWLGIVQPRYVQYKRNTESREPIRLKDMEDHLRYRDKIETSSLQQLAQSVKQEEPIGRRLAAAIVALPL
ncbi:hypothetical protein BSZ35_00140 [Salinibacter sp. 10B]|uniref:SNF2-related protein n=1 Tax=Salinibacter sp. 10B TaxID=1923971 RepID=UPI000CF4C6E2|nr:SNF2-related protein [Salinibacter sp. 10B]PQJ36799.1 hypothetical protein BSZ35_00140 [Salinibacter sp. 10B]